MPQYVNNAACGVMWKQALYIVGGEIEGRWSNKAYKFDFKEFGLIGLKDMDRTLKMGSLAPIHSDSLGFFIAGQNIQGSGEVQFYSIEFDNWYPV